MKEDRRYIKTISMALVASLFTGMLPWNELRADANTHGEYDAYPFEITYEQNSTWNNSTQGTIELTNTTEYSVTSWSLEIDYFEDVTLSNIWNVTGSISDGKRIPEEIWDPLQYHDRRLYGFHLRQPVRGGAASGDGQ